MSGFQTVDIGHRGFSLDTALSVLEVEISKVQFEGENRCVKIIHGHGRGALRTAVRSWCENQGGRFRCVIFGEHYDIFNKNTSEMRTDCGNPIDIDLGKKNRAVTYIWLW